MKKYRINRYGIFFSINYLKIWHKEKDESTDEAGLSTPASENNPCFATQPIVDKPTNETTPISLILNWLFSGDTYMVYPEFTKEITAYAAVTGKMLSIGGTLSGMGVSITNASSLICSKCKKGMVKKYSKAKQVKNVDVALKLDNSSAVEEII